MDVVPITKSKLFVNILVKLPMYYRSSLHVSLPLQCPVPERAISANPGLKFCSIFVFYLLMYCLEYHLVLTFPFLKVKAQQRFVSLGCMFLGKKALLKIWINPGLNLTIFWRTGPRLFTFYKKVQENLVGKYMEQNFLGHSKGKFSDQQNI